MFRYGPAFHHDPGVFAWVFLALLVALVALGVAALVRMWTGAGGRGAISPHPFAPPFATHHAAPVDPALGELRLRYARGEIDRDEYARRAGDLGYPVPPGTAPAPPPNSPPSPGAG